MVDSVLANCLISGRAAGWHLCLPLSTSLSISLSIVQQVARAATVTLGPEEAYLRTAEVVAAAIVN